MLCPAFDRCNLSPLLLANNYCCYPHVDPATYISVGFNLTGGCIEGDCEPERIAGAIKRDNLLDMSRSHRLMPQPASAAIVTVRSLPTT